jgi:dihydroorotate dehydrogenase electron transfer subunit
MQTKLLELTQIGPIRAGVFDLPEKHWPKPGQYLPCQRLSASSDILVTNLFSILGGKGTPTLAPIPTDWYPGDEFQFLPPQGNGFQLPSSARRIGLLPVGVSPLRLLTLVKPALAQDASLALFLDTDQRSVFLDNISSQIEIVPQSSLTDNVDWLDYLAVDIRLEDLDSLAQYLTRSNISFDGQVLIRTMMPCRGLGTCGVCAVKTKSGWKMICKDGPIFDLTEVMNVA